MIFAEMEYSGDYWDIHDELKEYLYSHFQHIECGLQGDSWFWIFDGNEKVALDTFSSMKHQVKAVKPSPHVQQVISTLQRKYKVRVYSEPELEGHEDA